MTDPAKIALFDMDGTLVDYDGAMRAGLSYLRAPEEPEELPEDFHDEEKYPHIAERMNLIKRQPGWWRDLPHFELGWELLNDARKIGFDINILTKGPYNTTSAWTEKVDWCRKHLPYTKVTITEDKSTTYGRILVDDWPKYVEPWLAKRPRGVVIMPAHPWNDWSNPGKVGCAVRAALLPYEGRVFRYDGTSGSARTCFKAMEEAFKRK